MQAMLCLLLAVIAIATFVLKGKQWPTFISATLLGLFLGATKAGDVVVTWVSGVVVNVLKNLVA
jgi:hypothetical protein